MVNTSQYVLENEKGERYNLTAPAPVYLVNVQGLGVATKRSYASLGGGFFQKIDDEVPQEAITATLIYQEGAFSNYQALVNFIFQAKALYLCYTPLETEYRARVELNRIGKSARDGAGCMRADLALHRLTPLYEPVATEVTIDRGGPNVKAFYEHDGEYYYTFDDDLVYGPELTGDLSKQIYPAGHEASGWLLRYTGAAENPVVKLVGASGTVYGECHVMDTFEAGETLEISTAINDCHVYKIVNGEAEDLVYNNKVLMAYDPYPRAPVDEMSVLTIDADEPIGGSAELTLYRYYGSV